MLKYIKIIYLNLRDRFDMESFLNGLHLIKNIKLMQNIII